MKLLLVVLAVVATVAQVHCGLLGSHRNVFHEATADSFCVAANALKRAGWMNDDGTWSAKFHESRDAKECRNVVGKDPCDTADKVLSCISNRGLTTAVNVATFGLAGV